MFMKRIGICVMGFDPPLLPLKREENWIAIGLRSLFRMRREDAIAFWNVEVRSLFENVGECDRAFLGIMRFRRWCYNLYNQISG
jgi:hypothetical protein